MPAFSRLAAGCNMLTFLGHNVFGMNTVQLYMKVTAHSINEVSLPA